MAKRKVTITVDPEKLATARSLLGADSASATIEIALSLVIRREQLWRDREAYALTPPTDDETALGSMVPDWTDLADDTDWDAEWLDG